MKVGFDIRPALWGYAGIARYARELATALTRMDGGPYLELYAHNWRGGRPATHNLEPSRFTLHRGPLPARAMHRFGRLPGLDAGRFPAKCDVFHWTDYVYPPVRSCARVMTLHDAAFAVDPSFHGRNTPVLLQRVAQHVRQAEVVVVVSEPGRADAELMGVDPERVRVIPNGVSPSFRPRPADAPPLERRGYLLSVGTLEPRKNHARTLKALENLWDQDRAPDWVIVGHTGWDHEDFVAKLESSRHRERIHWLKSTDDEELLRLYQGCLALVYPSLHEGFGLPVLEAMACGKAVVVSDQTAPAWVAGDGGMRVQPRSVDSIQEGVERILEDQAWREQAARVLLRRAQEFTWENAARKTLAAYHEAIERFGAS